MPTNRCRKPCRLLNALKLVSSQSHRSRIQHNRTKHLHQHNRPFKTLTKACSKRCRLPMRPCSRLCKANHSSLSEGIPIRSHRASRRPIEQAAITNKKQAHPKVRLRAVKHGAYSHAFALGFILTVPCRGYRITSRCRCCSSVPVSCSTYTPFEMLGSVTCVLAATCCSCTSEPVML